MSRALGDWQTPVDLSTAVFEVLARRGVKWSRVLEPTCGTGSFLVSALAVDPAPIELVGLDIQARHLSDARGTLGHDARNVRLLHRNIFDIDLGKDIQWITDGPLLVVGNPPWVTNAELGSLGGVNRPHRRNIKGLSGLDAVTGAANFDIAESIMLKLMRELAPQKPTIALLVKTAVARNVFHHSQKMGWPVEHASIYRLDAHRAFGASVDACLAIIKCGGKEIIRDIPVYESISAREPMQIIGFSNHALVSDVRAYRTVSHLDGISPVEWRQGVKHDSASVLELAKTPDGSLTNKLGTKVEVESDHVFPLIKGTQLEHGDTTEPSRWIILTQHDLKQTTLRLRNTAPKLWGYLSAHRDLFEARRSRIYRGRPPFAIFGVGEYSFTDYKIAVSGLHKVPKFQLVGPMEGKPVIIDDTSYLLPCADVTQAAVLFSLLNTSCVTHLLGALMFSDSKRPVTKKLLQRVDLFAVLEYSDRDAVLTEVGELLTAIDDRLAVPQDVEDLAEIVAGRDRQAVLF